MCYEFVDGGQPYSVLTMSLGNAPCDGPEPVTSSGNTKGGGLSDFTASFAVAVVVVMMAALVPI